MRPFTRAAAVKPRAHSRIWAWKHYGVFLPDLPEPWRYLNTMTFIGSTGTRCFDNETVKAADFRRNATVLSSTAHGGQHHYQAYDIDQDCDFPDDGSLLRWGEHLTIRAEHPRYTLSGRYDGFSVDVELETTAQVSWFVDSPVYRHLSLLSPYRGTISDERGQTALEGKESGPSNTRAASRRSLFGQRRCLGGRSSPPTSSRTRSSPSRGSANCC